MKTTLVYFSGTGNSLAVARLVAAKTDEATLVPVREMLQRIPCAVDTETCGFVFPVYCQNAPEIVCRLARLLQMPKNAYVFAIATHNGDPGYSHFTLDAILRKKGQRLAAGFAVLMPGNSITPYNMTNTENERMQRLEASVSSVDWITDAINRKETLPYAGSATLRKKFKGFRNMFRHKVVYKVPEKFWVTDACNHCGLCARICPENNIRCDSASLTWGSRCQMCLACIHWCPQRAIQNGANTIHSIRYHHPEISIEDMLPPS